MSADDYWWVTRHPDGDGFTYVMGFASDEDEPSLEGRESLPKYATIESALQTAANDEHTEYGLRIDSVCYPDDDDCAGHAVPEKISPEAIEMAREVTSRPVKEVHVPAHDEPHKGIDWGLPPHAAEVLAMWGWPHGADLGGEGIFFQPDSTGEMRILVDCSDRFAWATSDLEELTEDDMPLLRECFTQLSVLGEANARDQFCIVYLPELFCARKRNMNLMEPFLVGEKFSDELRELFKPKP